MKQQDPHQLHPEKLIQFFFFLLSYMNIDYTPKYYYITYYIKRYPVKT